MLGYLQDSNGDKSSKRLAGFILIVNGLILKNAEWFFGIFRKELITNIALSQDASTYFIGIGATLLGVGVLEGLTFSKKNI